MWVYTLINIIVLLLIIFLLYFMEKKHLNFTVRVLSALILGLLLGFVLRNIYAQNTDVITNTMIWYNVVGSGYVRLLQMLVMPLIFISITMALLNIKGDSNIAKMTMIIIAILMITTAISALVGILISKGFGLDASKIQAIVGDYSQGALNYENRLEAFNSKPVRLYLQIHLVLWQAAAVHLLCLLYFSLLLLEWLPWVSKRKSLKFLISLER